MSEPPRLPFTQVDAFTDRAFSGNPAAVLILTGSISEQAMQLIAAEMNLSETAFTGVSDGGNRWLRWFTPVVEVPLCGHATLATAHALIESGNRAPFRFDTASGVLEVHQEDRGLRMDFPADPPSAAAPPTGLLDALGCDAASPTLRARNLWVVRVADSATLRGLEPDHSGLRRVDLGPGGLGVAVTAAGERDVDFESRFFAPWVGIDEDPVTGVAHTALTPYWVGELGRDSLRCRQVSRRGGSLGVRLVDGRAHLTGSAVTVATGSIVRPSV